MTAAQPAESASAQATSTVVDSNDCGDGSVANLAPDALEEPGQASWSGENLMEDSLLGSNAFWTVPNEHPVPQRLSPLNDDFWMPQQSPQQPYPSSAPAFNEQDTGPQPAARLLSQALSPVNMETRARIPTTVDTAISFRAILGQEGGPSGQQPHLPDPYRNQIRIHQFCFVSACLSNAPLIGVSRDNACGPESPFYCAELPIVTVDVIQDLFSHLKKDLQPCKLQVTVKHPVYIDLIPFPKFRERVLALLATNPQAFPEDDLCEDLQNDGLVCWGSATGSGSGAPWDRRSWEAKPWFLKKWRMLTGGVTEDMHQQSDWWRVITGGNAGDDNM